MLQIMRMHLSLMVHKRGFKLSFSALMLYSLLTYLFAVISNLNQDATQLYSAFNYYIGTYPSDFFGYFRTLFPFIAVFSFSFSFLTDKLTGCQAYYILRTNKRRYYFSLLFTAFLGSAIIVFIPFLINALLLMLTFPEKGATYFGYFFEKSMDHNAIANKTVSFPYIFLNYTNLYIIIYCAFISLLSGMLGAFALTCSFWLKKHPIIVFLPPFLLLYLLTMADMAIYQLAMDGQWEYFNIRIVDYVVVTNFAGDSGKIPAVPIFFTFVFLLFCSIRTMQMSKKDVW